MNFADLSHHNPDPINWKVYGATRDRVALKATESTKFVDNKFKDRFQDTEGKRIAYHFQRVGFSASDQVANFLKTIKAAGFDNSKDCVVIDVEDIDTTGWQSKARKNTIDLCQLLVSKGFPQGVIYSYRYYLNSIGLKASDLPVGWRKLWIATYTSTIADTQVALPNGWDRNQVVARQYTDQAGVAGVTGKCDDNRVIIEWMNGNTQPTPDVKEDEDMSPEQADKVIKLLDSLNTNLEKLYRIGLFAKDADGNVNDTVMNNSVRGINGYLATINDKLDKLIVTPSDPDSVPPTN